MRQGTYLNVILTVNAALLTGVLWSQLAGHPVLATQAAAQSPGAPNSGVGIPNAADQRQKMIEMLRDLKASIEASNKTLASGTLKVEITNIDELRAAMEKK